MELLTIWNERIRKVQSNSPEKQVHYGLRKSPRYYAEHTRFVDNFEDAEAMLQFAMQRPLSHIGFDTEFGYDRPGVVIDKRDTRYDPTSIRPLLLSLAMVEPTDETEAHLYSFVIDLRETELLPILNELFRLPFPFIGHFVKVELFSLWKLGVSEPTVIWDTFIFEKLLSLGRFHHKYKLKKSTDEYDQIQAKNETFDKESFGLSLVATCQRYGVAYRMESEKERLQESFLNHPPDQSFSDEQIRYSAEDALAAVQLYPFQVQKAVQHGLLRHCETVEMAWVITNARIEWAGVRVDQKKLEEVVERIKSHLERIEKHLADEYGIQNSRSHNQLSEFFRECGLIQKFVRGQKITFEKKILKQNAELHPAIALLRAARRASDLLSDKILSSEFISEDGRIRAEHRQLGTDSGRQSSRWPNFLGLDRLLRPLVIPEDAYGIGEVDWSQVEVGVSAAIYGDDNLIRMFNTGDVYSAMAQNFFCDELPHEDLDLSGKEFKKKHKALRNQMKSCTLGLIYGITPIGLAQSLGCTKAKAAEFQKRFTAMFPQLQKALTVAGQYGGIRGYVQTMTGLRRFRGIKGEVSRWERNWMMNHPVQGSAAVVFKVAGNRLDKLYKQYGARIIIPLHDSFIFEAPLDELEAVVGLTSRVMCDTLQEYFPLLRPRVDVNISKPQCWNKDGNISELEMWIDELDQIMTGQKVGDNNSSAKIN